MAQPKLNLASALATLYISRGGSGADITANDDSADIIAKLYHLLGGNEATPKGTPMAELVYLLSTTQGGGGGSSSLIVTENDVNDAPVFVQSQLSYAIGMGETTITLNHGSVFGVQMSQDGSNEYSFAIKSDRSETGGMATYDAEFGGYMYTTSTNMNTSTNFTVTFKKQQK